MEDSKHIKESSIINLSNIAQVGTLFISLSIVFALVSLHLYYQMLLKIPIFQYLEPAEIALIGVSTSITLTFYMGALSTVNYITQKYKLNNVAHISICLFLYGFAFLYAWVAYRNDPIFNEFVVYPRGHLWIFIIAISVLVILVMYIMKQPIFKNNIFVVPMLITVWYALFTGWASYQVVTKSTFTINVILKIKNIGKISTDKNIIYAGRTKNYWFFYNRKTHFTRVVRNDDVEITDFNSK